MENARSKVVFSLSLRDRNLAPLVDWLYSGSFDPYRVKHELYSRKVMDYTEETREILPGAQRREERPGTRRGARPQARGPCREKPWGGGSDGSIILPTQWSHTTAESRASTDTSSRGQSDSESESESTSEVPVFIPIFGEELSNLQFLSLDE